MDSSLYICFDSNENKVNVENKHIKNKKYGNQQLVDEDVEEGEDNGSDGGESENSNEDSDEAENVINNENATLPNESFEINIENSYPVFVSLSLTDQII